MLPNDNVLMSVGHLDHVSIVYSSMHHVTWKSPGPMCGWVGSILHPDSCTSVSSWSKVPLLSIWSVAVPLCRPLLPCLSRLGQGKSGRQRGTVTDQMDKRGINRDAGSYQLSYTWDQVISRSRAPSSCKQSRRDQDVQLHEQRWRGVQITDSLWPSVGHVLNIMWPQAW